MTCTFACRPGFFRVLPLVRPATKDYYRGRRTPVQQRKKMRILLVSVIAAMGLAGGASAAGQTSDPPSTPRATTLTLDSFALASEVQYATNDIWCSFNDYGAYFGNYVV